MAGDVIQDAWLAVIKGLDRFEQRASLKTWIFHIAVNRANTRGGRDLRTVAFSGLPADEDDDASSSVPQQPFQRPGDGWPGHWAVPPRPWRTPTAAYRHWRHARTCAPPTPRCPAVQQAVLTLRDVEDLPSEEVCELLDLSAGNQRVILQRARACARASSPTWSADLRVRPRDHLPRVRRDRHRLPRPRAAADRLDLEEEHLVLCDWCRGHLDQLTTTICAVEGLAGEPPDIAVLDTLVSAFRDARGGTP